MGSLFGSLLDLNASTYLLAAANLVLLGLLGACMLRYRRLYLRTTAEHSNHRELIENLSEGIYRSSPDGRQLSANKALVKLNGYDSEAEMLIAVRDIGKEWYVEPQRRDEFRAILKRDGYVNDFVSEIYRHKTRERIWITESARIVYDKSTGEPRFYEGSVREITETRRKLQAEELLRKLSSQVPGGLFQFIRLNGGCYTTPYVSSGFRSLLGLDPDQDIEHPERFIDMIDAEDTALVKESLRVSGINMEAWHVEFRATAKDGKTKWLRIVAKPESIENGIIWHGYINDISLHKRHEMEIENLAFYDPLTGLPNRRVFMDRMAKAIACCNEQRNCSALIFIDLDNF